MKSKILLSLCLLGFFFTAFAQEEQKSFKKRQKEFHAAAKRAEMSTLRRLLKTKGIKISDKDAGGNTVLHHAVRRNNLSLARFYLSKKGKVNARNRSGNTALHLAAGRGRMAMINLLLSNGANVNISNYNFDSPFHSAAISGRISVAKYLMRRGVKNKFIKFKPVTEALVKAANNTKAFIEKPDLVGGKFEDENIDKILRSSVKEGDLILADESCPLVKIKGREKEPFIILRCSLKEVEIKGDKYTFGVRIRYSTRWGRGEKTSARVNEEIKRMPNGVNFRGFIRIVNAGHEQPYLYDVYRTAEDKIIVDGRIYSVVANKGEKKKK